MTHTFSKENVADMTYEEIAQWHEDAPAFILKPNLATYVIWKDGMFMGEGDFFHRQADGTYRYSHTVDYENPHEWEEKYSGDGQNTPDPEPDSYMPPESGEVIEGEVVEEDPAGALPDEEAETS